MLDLDPNREPTPPRDAASVILLRARADGAAEVFLLRRHRKASFMPTATVFPGGAADPGEDDMRVTAARELFEEAGVLLASAPIDEAQRSAWRAALHEGAQLDALLDPAGVSLDLEGMIPFSHWITPSAEKKRFSARFYVAVLPEGQVPRFDNVETVSEVWLTPTDALAQSRELRLPPPQVRTLAEIQEAAEAGPAAVVAFARARAPHVRPILPRAAEAPEAELGFALLLPWDPDYEVRGLGEGAVFPPDHPHGGGGTRFVLVDGEWQNVSAT